MWNGRYHTISLICRSGSMDRDIAKDPQLLSLQHNNILFHAWVTCFDYWPGHCHNWGCSWLFSVRPIKLQNSIPNWTTATSTYFLINFYVNVQIRNNSNCWLCHVCPSVRMSTWNSTTPAAWSLWNLSTDPDFISARLVFVTEADCVVCQVLPATKKKQFII